ncbi:PREDICTED: apolipoprotein L3-like [Chinchilla lanigera]|uniref:apolipoprotein L3-like n=1 Tax=Chinchilla lanigera TaxID=34839 RepID=UPI00038F07C0|nr:PREDICTED: apolipoprotein L3-like [Chinchilla lanigera]
MASAPSPESNSFIKHIVECLLTTVSKEDLQQLLTQDEAWGIVKTKAQLSREEADKLHETLKERTADMAMEDEDRLQKVQQTKERFSAAFPKLKEEVEEDIEKLRALADQLDQVHRGCTVSNVVAGSTTAASAVLGLALAPFTAGISGILTGARTALGVASGVTSFSTSIVDSTNISSTESEARGLVSNIMDKLKGFIQEIGYIPPKVISSTEYWSQFLEDIGKTIDVIKQAKGDLHLIFSATYNMMFRNILFESGMPLNVVFQHSGRIMKIAEALLRVVNVFFFVIDMIDLAGNSKHLQEGAKSEYAEELRQWAQALQNHLKDLEEIQKWMSESHQ